MKQKNRRWLPVISGIVLLIIIGTFAVGLIIDWRQTLYIAWIVFRIVANLMGLMVLIGFIEHVWNSPFRRR